MNAAQFGLSFPFIQTFLYKLSFLLANEVSSTLVTRNMAAVNQFYRRATEGHYKNYLNQLKMMNRELFLEDIII